MKATIAQIAEALHKAKGNQAEAGRRLGMTRGGVNDRVKKSPVLQAIVHDYTQILVDEAESAMRQAIKERQPWAVMFTLSRQGKDRGWVDKTQIDQNTDMQITVVYDDED